MSKGDLHGRHWRTSGAVVAAVAALGICATLAVTDRQAVAAPHADDSGLSVADLVDTADRYGAAQVFVARSDIRKDHAIFNGIGLPLEAGIDIFTPETGFADGLFLVDDLQFIDEGGELRTIAGTTLVAIGEQRFNAELRESLTGKGGSVTCGAGFYACCGKNQHSQWRAKCIPNGTTPSGGSTHPTSCIHGGESATSCSNPASVSLLYHVADEIIAR